MSESAAEVLTAQGGLSHTGKGNTMDLLPPWLRDDEDRYATVDDEAVIQMACWATGVYKEDWNSGDVPDVVWDIHDAGLTAEVSRLIEAGASWDDAFEQVKDRL